MPPAQEQEEAKEEGEEEDDAVGCRTPRRQTPLDGTANDGGSLRDRKRKRERYSIVHVIVLTAKYITRLIEQGCPIHKEGRHHYPVSRLLISVRRGREGGGGDFCPPMLLLLLLLLFPLLCRSHWVHNHNRTGNVHEPIRTNRRRSGSGRKFLLRIIRVEVRAHTPPHTHNFALCCCILLEMRSST